MILWLGALVLAASGIGCDRSTPRVFESGSPHEKAADSRLEAAENRSEAFIGMIEAHENGGIGLAVKYWIGPGHIRREIAELDRDGKVGPPEAGVIVDLAKDAVTLYRAHYESRASVHLTLAEYAEFLDENPYDLYQHGIGSTFLPFRDGSYVHETTRDVAELAGYSCDRLTIRRGSSVIHIAIADYSREIYVPHALLSTVELDLPRELEGFPLRVSYTKILKGHQGIDVPGEGLTEFLRRSGEWLSKTLTAFSKEGNQVVKVDRRETLDNDFEVPEGFPEVPSLDDFRETFRPPRSSRSWLDELD